MRSLRLLQKVIVLDRRLSVLKLRRNSSSVFPKREGTMLFVAHPLIRPVIALRSLESAPGRAPNAQRNMRTFDLIASLISPTLQIILLITLLRRRLYRKGQFPSFFVYTLYSIIEAFIRISTFKYPVIFFAVYWSTEMFDGVLALMAVLEVFSPALRAYVGTLLARVFAASAFSGVVVAAIWQGYIHPMGRTILGHFAAGAYSFALGILCLEVVVLLVCLKLARQKPFPIRWGRYRLGVLLGFGLAGCASAIVYMARFKFGPSFEMLFRYGPPGAYIGGVMIWIVAFARPEEPPPPSRLDLQTLKAAADYITREVEIARRYLSS